MTSEQFIYWLQGFIEIADPKQMDEKQIQIVKDHIALVLKKETPDYAKNPNTWKVPSIVEDPNLPEDTIIITTGQDFTMPSKPLISPGIFPSIFTSPKCRVCGEKSCTGLQCKSLIATC